MDPIKYIKMRAKQIRRDEGIPLFKALDLASQDEGFNNWIHFLNEIQNQYEINKPTDYQLHKGL